MATTTAGYRKGGYIAFAWSIVWILSYFAARVMLKSMGAPHADWARVGVALVPLIPFVLFLWTFIGDMRNADEMERRINLEALAWAYPLAMVLIMVLALLQLAMPLKPEDWSYRHIWPFFWVFWLFGQAFARRRYQ
jgi:hypothetical protein